MKFLKEALLLSFGAAAGAGVVLSVTDAEASSKVIYTDFVCEDEQGGELHHGRAYGSAPEGALNGYGEVSYYGADGSRQTLQDCPRYRQIGAALRH